MENHQGSDGLEVDYILGLDVLIRIYETMKDTDQQNQRFCRIAIHLLRKKMIHTYQTPAITICREESSKTAVEMLLM